VVPTSSSVGWSYAAAVGKGWDCRLVDDAHQPVTPSLRKMTEHPLYRMWMDRRDAEVAQEQARAARRAIREAEHAGWHEAWRTYKAHLTGAWQPEAMPRWWNILGWVRWLMRLHSPGRPN
jgi:hypothetical protein